MIVFVPALDGGMVQHDAVAVPVFNEMKRRGASVKWGSFQEDADWYVCTAPRNFKGKLDRTIYLPHGIGLQEHFQALFPAVLFPGQYYREVWDIQYSEYKPPSGWDDTRLPLIGWPKSDVWFNPKERERRIEEAKRKLRLPHPHTVFIAGAYAGGKDVVNKYVVNGITHLINGWSKTRPINIIFKGHSISTVYLNPETEKQEREHYVPEWLPIKERMDSIEYCNFVDPFESADIYDLIMVSDVVVSTQSGSVYTETLITGKPIIQLGMRWFTGLKSLKGEAVTGNGPYWRYTYTTETVSPYPQIFLPGLVCEPHEIWRNVDIALNEPKRFKSESDAFVNAMIYKPDGHASERAADAIERINS